MTWADVLFIIVIILVAVLCYSYQKGKTNMLTRMADPVINKVKSVVVSKEASAENAAMSENLEYFAAQCSAESQLGSMIKPCQCDDDSSLAYARSDYGPSSDYTTWIMNSTIDPTVAANHKEFISDRTGENSSVNVIGRTYTPEDSHQSYTPPNTWIGIRGRPSLVPVCSPDQVNDVNFGYYPKDQKLKWDSSSTYEV